MNLPTAESSVNVNAVDHSFIYWLHEGQLWLQFGSLTPFRATDPNIGPVQIKAALHARGLVIEVLSEKLAATHNHTG